VMYYRAYLYEFGKKKNVKLQQLKQVLHSEWLGQWWVYCTGSVWDASPCALFTGGLMRSMAY
jgi:hypothetical protein